MPSTSGTSHKKKPKLVPPSAPQHPKKVGERLRLTREALGYTQAFIARRCDMSAQAWNNNECGRDRISLEAALRLCVATGVDLDWIYRGLPGNLPADLAAKIAELQKSRRR